MTTIHELQKARGLVCNEVYEGYMKALQENERLSVELDRVNNFIDSQCAKLLAERDMAIADLKSMNNCPTCLLNENGHRYACELLEMGENPHDCINWQWRGVKAADNE